MGELRAGDDSLFEIVKSDEFFGVEDDFIRAFTASSLRVEKGGQSRRAGNVVAVEVYKSEKRLDVANCCWYGPGKEVAEFGRIGGDAGGVHDVPQIENLVAKKLTLRRFLFEAGAEDTSKSGAKIVEMLSEATSKHYNVVEIREADS